jgi:small-conductance mechanosensitive channel
MKEQLIAAFSGLGHSIVSAIPRVSVGILLVILGLILARIAEVVSRVALVRLRFDTLIEKAGIARAFVRIGLLRQSSLFVPKLVYFSVIFLFAKTASDAVGWVVMSSAIDLFFSYLPNILAALLLLIVGMTVGPFAGRIVTQAAVNSKIDSASVLGKVVSALIIFVIAMMAISQLKIDTEMVRILTSFVLGGAALAFGLAFGRGTWDIVRNIAMGFYARKLLTINQTLEIAGQRGILTEITSTHTVLKTEGQKVFVANATFLEQMSKQ